MRIAVTILVLGQARALSESIEKGSESPGRNQQRALVGQESGKPNTDALTEGWELARWRDLMAPKRPVLVVDQPMPPQVP